MRTHVTRRENPVSCRDVALKRRKALLFGKTEEQQLGTTGLFNLFTTFPWHIHKHSSLLALHLSTIGLFIILLLLYSLIALYPIAATFSADNFHDEFVVVTNNGTSADPAFANINRLTCSKYPDPEDLEGFTGFFKGLVVRYLS